MKNRNLITSSLDFTFQGGLILACMICDGVFWHSATLPMNYKLPVCLELSKKWVQMAGFTSSVSSGYLNPMDGYVLGTKIHPFGNLRVEI